MLGLDEGDGLVREAPTSALRMVLRRVIMVAEVVEQLRWSGLDPHHCNGLQSQQRQGNHASERQSTAD